MPGREWLLGGGTRRASGARRSLIKPVDDTRRSPGSREDIARDSGDADGGDGSVSLPGDTRSAMRERLPMGGRGAELRALDGRTRTEPSWILGPLTREHMLQPLEESATNRIAEVKAEKVVAILEHGDSVQVGATRAASAMK